ncbi:MAG TPA: DUF92 domain-containing protein [Vicinamibacterales bacterium]|nr:DUF92 domain-containing protein [Vicinamibacterales bacterium]
MRADEAFSEDTRQGVHIAMGGFALALPLIPWWQATILASLAVAFNLFALQKLLGLQLFRPGERLRRLSSGIVLYPLSVVGLLLIFPNRLDIVAAAWGILAAGDGMATIVGRRFPIAAIPWNPRKSLGGSVALAVFGGAAGAALSWWCRDTVVPPAYLWYLLGAPIAAAIVAAAVETIPIALDDNVSVTASAAAVLWTLSLVSNDLVTAAMQERLWTIPLAVSANVIVAAAGYRAGSVTVSGTVGGVILGSVILVFAGIRGWTLLLLCFACAVATSRMGLARKRALGIEEERGGRRGAGNAMANTGLAAIAAAASVLTYAHGAGRLAFVAALVAGASDTVASEIGKAWGRRTFLVSSAKPVAPGTPGAMSAEGTAAGAAAAALLALAGAALGLIPLTLVAVVVVAATAGALVESALSATLEHRGVVNNDVLNFLNTAVAVFVAIKLWRLL